MAKRKRLTPANPAFLTGTPDPAPVQTPRLTAAPIADVARDASSVAAAEEIALTLHEARSGGRMVISVPLEQVQMDYLVRDRVVVADEDMQALKDSLRGRGQQTPVELVELTDGRYGLISGWRRCAALRALHDETGEARFTQVQGLLRRPGDQADAYQAMVEENEIRVGLSYFERARIVLKAVEQRVFDSDRTALQTLFASASRARRSKIGSFLPLVAALDGALRFPEAISERLGLQLSRALGADDTLGAWLRKTLDGARPETPEEEIALLETGLTRLDQRAAATPATRRKTPGHAAENQSLSRPVETDATPSVRPSAQTPRQVTPSIRMHYAGDGRLTLEGHDIDDTLRDDLIDWLRVRHLGHAGYSPERPED